MRVPRRAIATVLVLLSAILSQGAEGSARVLREVRSPDGKWTLQWLGAMDGACTGMRLLDGKSIVERPERFTQECSRITEPFSPDGQYAVFMADPVGPIHVVTTRSLAGYFQGDMMAERVVYPSETPGMPPRPEKLVEFLGWRSDDVFELSGACCGGASRYSYIISQSRILETCHKDALRPSCMRPSVDNAHTVLLTSSGFHVLQRAAVDRFLVGQAQSTFVPADAWKGITRPVFLEWSKSGTLVVQGEAEDAQPHLFTVDVTTGTITRGKRVEWDWKREIP